jgi:anthranilate 1,2-dioxygenase small subunit
MATAVTTPDIFRLIGQLQADYCRCIDNDELERWPDLFVEDCVYRVTTAENDRAGFVVGMIDASSRGMLADRISALRQANIYERHSYRHILGQPAIVEESETEGRCETSFLIVRIMQSGETSIFATGCYRDRYRIEQGAARLVERIVVCDSRRIDTLLVIPL